MSWGFVYYLENWSMPGLVKIGFSRNHPAVRAAQLSSATACPEPFRVLAYFGTQDAPAAERGIHAELSKYRVNDSREFFEAPFWELQEAMRRWGDPFAEAFVSGELDQRTLRPED